MKASLSEISELGTKVPGILTQSIVEYPIDSKYCVGDHGAREILFKQVNI